MNPKQAVPLVVTLAPVIAAAPALLVGGVIGCGVLLLIKWLGTDSKEKQPDTLPTIADAENQRTLAEIPAIPQIPPKPIVRPASVPVPSVPSVPVQTAPVRPVPVIRPPAPVVVPAIKAVTPAAPLPINKKFVTRADLATVFENGARSLNRTAAVAALKRLGFGKTAAYSALSPGGRFNAWLHCAPDGIITWKN